MVNAKARFYGNWRGHSFEWVGVRAVLGMLVMFCLSTFVIMVLQAVALRWSVSLTIEIFSWWREVLNNLAGAIGA